MRRLASKRQRKHKERSSLKRKALKPAVDGFDKDGAGAEQPWDSNAEILTGPPPEVVSEDEGPVDPLAGLSKNARRKLRRVEEEKAAKARRADVLASLKSHELPAAALAALRPVSKAGQRATRREVGERDAALAAAGVVLEGEARQLLGPQVAPRRDRRRAVGDGGGGVEGAAGVGGTGSSDSDSEDDASAPRGAAGGRWDRNGMSADDDMGLSSSSEEDATADDGPLPVLSTVPRNPTPSEAAVLAGALAELAEDGALPTSGVGPDGVSETRPEDASNPALMPASVPAESYAERRVVLLPRSEESAAARERLPVTGHEQEVMEALARHDICVLCGETGSGKTTQVPQFLLEAGYGCARFPERSGAVAVTQPRRVAAVAAARRVASELGTRLGGKLVGYAVRHDRAARPDTALRFVTDGLLLRELRSDFLLSSYSAVVVDEAHERSLSTDLLLGLLSRCVALRRRRYADKVPGAAPLKLLVMSATLRTDDFVANPRLFSPAPPLLKVPARQFPVTVHFARRTPEHDYVGAAVRKVAGIHRRLPPGGVLLFLTGAREVTAACAQLRGMFGGGREAKEADAPADAPGADADEAAVLGGADGGADAAESAEAEDPFPAPGDEEDDDYARGEREAAEDEEEEETQLLGGQGFTPEEIAAAEAKFDAELAGSAPGAVPSPALPGRGTPAHAPVHVLPLYAMLPPAQQARVFAAVPAGHRLIVVATNVAETSLTIPGIRYVVDAGRSKQRVAEEGSAGVARYAVGWISQASAEQRAGRAGRTGPGHCYRLFSSALFVDTMEKHAAPELARVPLEGVVLGLKSLGVHAVSNFPFPSPPPAEALAAAQAVLVRLGAVAPGGRGEITPLGRRMAAYPLAPRHARMLEEAREIAGRSSRCADGSRDASALPRSERPGFLAYAVALAAAVSAESPFATAMPGWEGEAADAARAARRAQSTLRDATSDALGALRALCGFEAAEVAGQGEAYAAKHALLARHLREAVALRRQLARQLPDAVDASCPPAVVPEQTARGLRRALAAGWADRAARRVRGAEHLAALAAEGKGAKRAVRYEAAALEEPVFMHPASGMHAVPEFAVALDVVRGEKRAYMTGVSAIDPAWLPEVCPTMAEVTERPLRDPAPAYLPPPVDAVVAWHATVWGPRAWPAPRTRRALPPGEDRAAVFAAALLEGRVSGALAPLTPHLALRPGTLALPHVRCLPAVAELLAALRGADVAERAGLLAALADNPTFLGAQIRALAAKAPQTVFDAAWRALLAEASASV